MFPLPSCSCPEPVTYEGSGLSPWLSYSPCEMCVTWEHQQQLPCHPTLNYHGFCITPADQSVGTEQTCELETLNGDWLCREWKVTPMQKAGLLNLGVRKKGLPSFVCVML